MNLRLFFLFQSGGIHQALYEVHMADINLEFLKPYLFQPVYNHGKHLCVRFDGIHADQLRPHLGIFLQPALIAGMVDKCIAHIAEPDGVFFCLEQRCRRPGYGRRDVRAQCQCIAVPVKKFIEFSRRYRSDLFSEHIEVFESRCLNVLISVCVQYIMELFLCSELLPAFCIINIPDAFRCM